METPPHALDATHVALVGEAGWVDVFRDWVGTRTDATVLGVSTATAALDIVRESAVDCVICEYTLDGGTGIELVESIREETATLPIVMCTASGDETVASAAIGAGVSDYIALDEPHSDEFDDVLARVDRCVRDGKRSMTRQDRACQFDAIFHDSRTATWVLDAVGALTRVNETARDQIPYTVEDIIGEPFWTLPWWTHDETIQTDVRRVVETALQGEFGHAVVTHSPVTESANVVELSARPVHDGFGNLVSVVVQGVDITERVTLERDLRQSEELHRVTLNNMTDTVLMTDDTGEYTYVCPNVHFIFGYTDEEIHQHHPIDDLLGEDLFDRDELAAKGVLKNIECTATDKAGREHTLLVNVREVSIQDGSLLYSCRDITKRKQREEALATLHGTARDFLYAETPYEIAQHVVDDASGVVNLDASAVYLFDADENELQPVAQSAAMRELNGPLPAVRTDDPGLVSHSFLHDEPQFFDDVHDSERLDNRATDLRSVAYIPLGDHGVFIVGSAVVGQFDSVSRELADLLAATGEAALDRVRREGRLRRQERELQQRNTELTALNRINEIIREIDQALVGAETRTEIDHAVCERLTDDDRFAFAWIGVVDTVGDVVEPRSWAGEERGYLDEISFTVAESGVEPAGRTAATQSVTTVDNVAEQLREEAWRTNALSRDFLSVLSVPLAYDEFTYGVLTVYADAQDAFDDTAREVVAELGETVASATSAIERKNALLTTSVTRVEFAVDDPSFVLTRLAREADCQLSYRGGVQQTEHGSDVFVTVDGASVEAVQEAANALVAIERVQPISSDASGGVVRLRIAQPFLALELAGHGAVLQQIVASDAETTLRIDIPESVDVRHITRLVSNSVDGVDLRSKRTLDGSSTRDLYSRFLERVTDRQLEVIQTAYYSGFFEAPRESTGEDVAAALDISPAAFYRHARTVQRKLFSTLFDEVGVAAFPATES
ncbi:bacterio-opsin activator domain-containing protein [Halomarina oriensis]|uniref:PAS domain S-box protein n=1 Tax=Halomarina oriensis TaxID=671145 RepID=A0A6B0GIX1_9EURY|nr:bacterio-opsin activator domain-containing protein [Halomarina oriensis]MWG33807.1 PAS domain S-box protein [Halomarina oriensis]